MVCPFGGVFARTKVLSSAAWQIGYRATHVPLIWYSPFRHRLEGPQSVSNEHVLPRRFLTLGSSGSYTGFLSHVLPGFIPPMHMPLILKSFFTHLLPTAQSVSNWQARALEQTSKSTRPIERILSPPKKQTFTIYSSMNLVAMISTSINTS